MTVIVYLLVFFGFLACILAYEVLYCRTYLIFSIWGVSFSVLKCSLKATCLRVEGGHRGIEKHQGVSRSGEAHRVTPRCFEIPEICMRFSVFSLKIEIRMMYLY